jgi:hypothetical protein
MKVIYHVNPLATYVEINEEDRKKIYESIKDIWFKESEQAKDYKPEYVKVFEDALLGDHSGDCTLEACSCLKCWAEDALEIRTISNKDINHAIAGAFAEHKEIAKVYEYLESDPIKNKEWEKADPSGERWNASLERWNISRRNALNWLKEYHIEHGFV